MGRVKFSEKQLDAILDSDAWLNIWEGSVRSGKTYSSIIRWVEFIKSGPPGLFMMAGNSVKALGANVLDPMFEILGPSSYRYARNEGCIYMPGRKIYIWGANKAGSEDSIKGQTYAGAYVDELTTIHKDFFIMLLSRLSVQGAKLFATTNPGSPYHWLLKEYLEKEGLDLKRFSFYLDDNPALSEEYKTNIKSAYVGVWYQRLILGKWVIAEGLVYPGFDEKKNVLETVDREYTEYHIVVDYGIQNPMTFGLWGYCPALKKWVKIKEYYHDGRKSGQKTDGLYYKDIEAFAGKLPIQDIIVDPSAASFISEIRQAGNFMTRKARNDVIPGIARMATALERGEVAYNDCCTETIKEIHTYAWDKKQTDAGMEAPIKENDHAMDSDRYFIYTVLGKVNIRIQGGIQSK